MSTWTVTLDPPAAITGRTALALGTKPYAIKQDGIDWGEAAIKAYLAEAQFGESAVDWRVPNRVVTIPLAVGTSVEGTFAEQLTEEEEARRKLQRKVALLQREGGVLLRQTEGGLPLYADIVNAGLNIPDQFGDSSGIEPNVSLRLECLPDFYGDEIALDATELVGQVVIVLKKAGVQAVVGGDYPARCRIALTEKAGQNQRGLLWGLRSRTYDPAATARLFYDAKELTPVNGAAVVANFGGFSATRVELAAPEVKTWHPFLSTDVSGAQLTHVGSYRVWARVETASQEPRLRLAWSLDDATSVTLNPPAKMEVASAWQLLDLGEIRLDPSPVGTHWWRGMLQVESGSISHEIYVDRIWFQPIDDGGGQLRATAVPTQGQLAPSKAATEVQELESGQFWSNPQRVLTANVATNTLNKSGEFGSQSKWLAVEKAGFNLPVGATVHGIQFNIPLWESSSSAVKLELRLIKGGTLSGETKVYTNFGGNISGGAVDLWGLSWLATDINAAGFGVGIRFTNTGATSNFIKVTGPVAIRVYYTYSSAAVAQDAVLYAAQKSEVRTEGAFRSDTGTSYAPITTVLGDLPRLPPSGLESRPAELFVKNSRGNFGAEADPGIDKVQAQVFYRPCYIGRI